MPGAYKTYNCDNNAVVCNILSSIKFKITFFKRIFFQGLSCHAPSECAQSLYWYAFHQGWARVVVNC